MRCLICGNEKDFTKLSPEFTDTDNHLCMECGLAFIPREGGKFAKYYKDSGYYTDSPNIAARPFLTSRSMLISLAKERIENIKSLVGKDLGGLKVLDAGCGYGEILYVLKKDYQCEVLGIEPSKTSAEIGSKMFGIEIKSILLGEYSGNEKFDLIICNHTLEHLEDPIEFLIQIRALLKNDGKLYLEVPNILHPSGGFDLKTFLYFEHLQTFSASTLDRLLDKVGLGVEAYSDRGFLQFVCSARPSRAKIPVISAKDILKFLTDYKSRYSVISTLTVYLGKFIYLMKLLPHKLLDLIHGH